MQAENPHQAAYFYLLAAFAVPVYKMPRVVALK